MGNKLSQDYASQFLGKTLTVLAENQPDPEEELLFGYTENYIPLYFSGKEELRNKLIRTRLIGIKKGKVLGEVEAGVQ